MSIKLKDYQIQAAENMTNGCILCGGVGSGKSRTAIYYYFQLNGGSFNGIYTPMDNPPMDLYIITTARKRDTSEWDEELALFLLGTKSAQNIYTNKVVIDSWNNIEKYKEVINAFFIFDEQRVVGSGAWVKAFLRIAKCNKWVLLSATPGDSWSDYIPVFIANGFYKNRTEFLREHVVYKRFTKFPMIDRYLNTGRLIRLKNKILVTMDFNRDTVAHHEDVWTEYNMADYKYCTKNLWDVFNNCPFENSGDLCRCLRHIVNSDKSRLDAVEDILNRKKKVIIFYNFDYELDALKSLLEGLNGVLVGEWNGHKHQDIPTSEYWAYLVQYAAGAEGWNCVYTDTIIFFSQNYSYKVMVQASGRIDRMNTPFHDLYYYHLKSHSSIDLAIARALQKKKNFNENRWAKM